jgi:ornithine--oxo-acid transaminase
LQGFRSSRIVEIRGKGLWIGIELNVQARPVCEALQQRGVLCKETHDTVIRLAPPLTVSREDLSWGLDQIEAVLAGS